MKKIVLACTILLFITGFYLTFLAPPRFGTHGDSLPCGENSAVARHNTATEHFLLTDTGKPSDEEIGTCPYQYYEAKTFAVEIWAMVLVSGALLYRNSRAS